MLRILSDYLLYKKIQKLNNNEFNQERNLTHEGILLLEFNSFHILHIIFSLMKTVFLNLDMQVEC